MEKKLTLNNENVEKAFQEAIEAAHQKCGINILDEFFKKHPLNNNPLIVAAKIALVDTTYSTFLARYKQKISLCDLVKIILSINDFDFLVKNGDAKAVTEIAKNSKSLYNINLFSFATKYCCLHNFYVYGRDDYSMYDRAVRMHLPLYAPKNLPISINTIIGWKNNINYIKYNNYIGEVLNAYNITIPYKRRAFDLFLWKQK